MVVDRTSSLMGIYIGHLVCSGKSEKLWGPVGTFCLLQISELKIKLKRAGRICKTRGNSAKWMLFFDSAGQIYSRSGF